MNTSVPAPAVPDENWLEPEDLYLSVGKECELDRPIFQGDVFCRVPLPRLPSKPPEQTELPIPFTPSLVMVVPHPCQCYNGDKLRATLTVAPVREVAGYSNFGDDRTRAIDKFALLDLPNDRSANSPRSSHVADFGKLLSINPSYLKTDRRVACLSHKGLGLLAKRLLRFQLRAPSQLAQVMAYTMKQWNESFIMQAWVRRFGSLKGYSDWQRHPTTIPELGGEVVPDEYVISAADALIRSFTEPPTPPAEDAERPGS